MNFHSSPGGSIGPGRWRSAAIICCCLASSTLVHSAPKAAVHTVVIEGMQFAPSSLEVNAGDTIIWKNKDLFPHTATAEGKKFDSGTLQPGQQWKYVAKERGTFQYLCTLHPPMKATLIVK
jgi:plastocyanin